MSNLEETSMSNLEETRPMSNLEETRRAWLADRENENLSLQYARELKKIGINETSLDKDDRPHLHFWPMIYLFEKNIIDYIRRFKEKYEEYPDTHCICPIEKIMGQGCDCKSGSILREARIVYIGSFLKKSNKFLIGIENRPERFGLVFTSKISAFVVEATFKDERIVISEHSTKTKTKSWTSIKNSINFLNHLLPEYKGVTKIAGETEVLRS